VIVQMEPAVWRYKRLKIDIGEWSYARQPRSGIQSLQWHECIVWRSIEMWWWTPANDGEGLGAGQGVMRKARRELKGGQEPRTQTGE
jgi:hypothetical protein